ncbi:MAG: hypothetical protein LUH58_07340 [Lachnospiraceae bacterium]|nr:hypothetical protein [Lachnospiraceae bacterium]
MDNLSNLFSVLVTTAKSKITPLVTKFRLWTSWDYIWAKLVALVQNLFTNVLNIKPRHKKDYYEIFGWLVSKKLAYAAVAVAGVLSLYYLISVRNILPESDADAVKSYSYDSLLLRFASGTVQIKAASGYLAYEGEVDSGAVTGYGTLYNSSGVVVYQGNFEYNQYDGTGTRYYDDGTLMYTGDFVDNEFSGSGKLYRESGTLEYDGEFLAGYKEGSGSLYDVSGSLVYTGTFSKDEPVYSELLGQKASDISGSYTGERLVYDQDDSFAVVLTDIGAIYANDVSASTLEDEITADRILVLKSKFTAGNSKLSDKDSLDSYFGTVAEVQTVDVDLSQAVAFYLTEGEECKISLEVSQEYDDYLEVEAYSGQCTAYTYTKDGLTYTFLSTGSDGTFSFYTIEKEEGRTG